METTFVQSSQGTPPPKNKQTNFLLFFWEQQFWEKCKLIFFLTFILLFRKVDSRQCTRELFFQLALPATHFSRFLSDARPSNFLLKGLISSKFKLSPLHFEKQEHSYHARFRGWPDLCVKMMGKERLFVESHVRPHALLSYYGHRGLCEVSMRAPYCTLIAWLISLLFSAKSKHDEIIWNFVQNLLRPKAL